MPSSEVTAILEAAGWTSKRSFSIAPWVDELAAEGFTVSPSAEQVMASFGNLTVRPPRDTSFAYNPEVIVFDPLLAASGEFDRVDFWQSKLGISLTPIAETGGGAILLVAEDGRVFSCWDQVLWLDGDSIDDAFENTLIMARKRPCKVGTMIE